MLLDCECNPLQSILAASTTGLQLGMESRNAAPNTPSDSSFSILHPSAASFPLPVTVFQKMKRIFFESFGMCARSDTERTFGTVRHIREIDLSAIYGTVCMRSTSDTELVL